MKTVLTLLLIILGGITFAQNKTDAQGKKQGVWKKAYKGKTSVQYVGQFKDDKPYGEFTYYYVSGRVQSKMTFLIKGQVAYSVMYHESSGYIMAKGKYLNEQKDSLWVYYDNKGQLKSQESYKNGKLNGQRVVYYEPINGQYRVARFEYYQDGALHGQFKEYYPNTKLKAEGVYRTGNLNGIVKFYRPNGKMERVERYKFAVRHGWWMFYDEDGKMLGKELFWEGKKLKEGPYKEAKIAELKAEREKQKSK